MVKKLDSQEELEKWVEFCRENMPFPEQTIAKITQNKGPCWIQFSDDVFLKSLFAFCSRQGKDMLADFDEMMTELHKSNQLFDSKGMPNKIYITKLGEFCSSMALVASAEYLITQQNLLSLFKLMSAYFKQDDLLQLFDKVKVFSREKLKSLLTELKNTGELKKSDKIVSFSDSDSDSDSDL